jgi:hypothetical protein
VRRLFEQLVLERSVEIAEARDGGAAGLANLGPAVADRDAEIFGYALRDLAGMSSSFAGGMSPVLDQDTVGNDISSATQGSSVAKVAGKNRAPTKQWAKADDRCIDTNNSASAGTLRYCEKRVIDVLQPSS